MTAPLIITRAERTAAGNAVTYAATQPDYLHSFDALLDIILEAVNEHRAGGDPVGTIRRNKDGSYAVRVIGWGNSCWRVIHPDGRTSWDDTDCGTWPVVYNPEDAS